MKQFNFVVLIFSLCFFNCGTDKSLTKKNNNGLEARLARDTIFFKIDKNYTLFFNDYRVYFDESYKVFEKEILKNHVNGTKGYFMFKKEKISYNLKPKKIFSLKDYVENRDFYYSGKHNKIINTDFLKEKLFNKYKVILVGNDIFIEIRQNPSENFYYSFYPIKYEDPKKFPALLKDTLFINFDNSILTKFQYPDDKNQYYRIKGTGIKDSGFTYLKKDTILKNLNPSKTISFSSILKNNNLYYKKGIVDDFKLTNYLSNYVLILKEESKFIKVISIYEIE